MNHKDNQKLEIILKWTFRIVSVISLLTIGVVILIFGLQPINTHRGWKTRLNTEVISILMVGVIGGLTITGGKMHAEIANNDKEKKETLAKETLAKI